jgi:hypothetical protein
MGFGVSRVETQRLCYDKVRRYEVILCPVWKGQRGRQAQELLNVAARPHGKINALVEHAKLYACCGDVQSYSPSGKHCLRRPGVDTLTATAVLYT